jgi:rhodanese-related sulfurtransferase
VRDTNARLVGYHRVVPESTADPFARGALLLDVRSPEELAAGGTLPGALHVPLGALPSSVPALVAEADARLGAATPVLVFCRLGRRAAQAVEFLRGVGFRNVCNLGGVEVEPVQSWMAAMQRPASQSSVRWAQYGEQKFRECSHRWQVSQDPDALLGMYRHAYGAELNFLDAGPAYAARAEHWGHVRARVRANIVARLQAR